MSNIYIQEPPTSGKVLLQTSVGDIDIELWAKETPKASRNFIQLCLEGYYNGTIFHRLVKGFIVQGGDPNGDGTGGESIYDAPFKDEFHTRLRFSRRGLVAMANSGKDDNGSQFFFTLNATPELQNKHTIFGKVIGDTVYNMLKLEDGLVDDDEKPVYPHKILKTEVLINPFPDIVPRCIPAKVEKKEKKKKHDRSGVKDFKLLSFGEEAQEDEELTTVANEQFSGKSKSTHDLLKDPKLSTQPAIEDDVLIATVPTETEVHEAELETIRQKLKSKDYKKNTQNRKNTKSVTENVSIHEDEVEEEEEEYYFGKDKADEQKKKMENIRKEIKQLKQSYHSDKLTKKQVEVETKKEEKKRNEMINEYEQEQEKYREAKKALPKKGTSREQYTLSLLKKFQEKLNSAKQKAEDENIPDNVNVHENDEGDEEDDKDGLWLAHKLKFDSHVPVLARDANTKDDNWYEIDDPRNPLNKRRREDSKSSSKEKRHKR